MPGSLILPTGQGFVWNTAIDYDLVKITSNLNQGPTGVGGASAWLVINTNASGRIGRLEIDANGDADSVRIQTMNGGTCRIGVEDGGYCLQHTRPTGDNGQAPAHQDGVQATNGSHVLFQNLVFKTVAPNGSSQVCFINNAGGEPTDIIFDSCVGGPDPSANGSLTRGWGTGFKLDNCTNCHVRNCWMSGVKNGANNVFVLTSAAISSSMTGNHPVNNSDPTMTYAMNNLRVPWLAPGSGGGTFSRTASRELIVVRSSAKAMTRSRTATRDHAESHSVILGGGGTTIDRPRQADRLADVIRARTVDISAGRTVSRLPDVTRSADVGQVIYRQWAVPWTSTEANPNCSVTITNGNRVQAFTFQATTGDVARAIQTGAQYMPGAYIKGRLRFRVTQKQSVYGQSQGIFGMRVAAGTSPFRFQFDAVGDRLSAVLPRMSGGANHLTVSDILGSSPVVGQTYLLEWKLDRSTTGLQFYELKVDGVVVATGTPPAATTLDTVANFFEGFTDALNPNGVALGVTVEVWDLVLATADVPLPPEDLSGGPIEGEGSAVPEAILSGQGYLVGTGSI